MGGGCSEEASQPLVPATEHCHFLPTTLQGQVAADLDVAEPPKGRAVQRDYCRGLPPLCGADKVGVLLPVCGQEPGCCAPLIASIVAHSSGSLALYRKFSSYFTQFYSFYDRKFDREGPFWGRYYIFWHGGKPLTVIQEVFSPGMDRWIGRMDVSPNDHTSLSWAQQTLP